jgi:hypothetical protein
MALLSEKVIQKMANCQDDFYEFCKAIEPRSEVLQSVLSSYHGQEICKFLTKVGNGQIKRGIINIPPRHCKTYLTKLFLVWYMGNYPDRDHILLSHTASLAENISGNIRDKFNTIEFKDIFPAVRLKEDTKSRSHFKLQRIGKKAGQLISAGVMGSILGHGISGIGLIDDPIGKMFEARNPDHLDKLYEFYRMEFESRLDSHESRILIIMQRMSEGDLCGKLLKDNPKDWHVLKLPIVKDDKPLWPDRFSIKRIEKIKRFLNNDYLFSCVYMQNPIDAEEKPFHSIKSPEILPNNMRTFSYFDPNWGGKDWSAYCAGGIFNGQIIITHGETWQGDLTKNYDKLEKEIIKTKPEKIIIESNSKGEAFLNEFKHRGYIVEGIEHYENKFLRIQRFIQSNWNRIYIDKQKCSNTFLEQIRNYKDPLDWTKKQKNVDSIDALSGLVEFLLTKETANEYIGKQTKWL